METKYDVIRKLESDASTTELAKVHDAGKATVIHIKKQKHDIENYLEHVDCTDAGNSRETLNIP